jgi:hypothetical protein
MRLDWEALTKLTGGKELTVERVRVAESGIAIEGEFELPKVARISAEDQVFIAAFVRSHGSIKEMEKLFGVSYPTIKNRLNRLSEQMPFVDVEPAPEPTSAKELLNRLERGELSAREVIAQLRSKHER